jgi:outer membrane protein assembly factor BamB
MPRLLCIAVVLSICAATVRGDDWPAWRGPQGTGVCAEKNLPLTWSATDNVVWKVPLPAPGNSTPIVWGDRVFVTGPQEEGRRRTVMCFNRADGALRWTGEIAFDGAEPTHATNPFCSASPVTDGERVIAWHGSAGMVAYDLDGHELWRRDLGEFHHIWGNAASPVIVGEQVIAHLGPGPRTMLVALDKHSGADLWQVPLENNRGKDAEEWKGSWSTPMLRPTGDGQEIIVSLPGEVVAFDVASGERHWSCQGLGDLVYTSALIGEEAVIAMGGYGGPALACRPMGEGDITDAARLWHHSDSNPQRIGSGVIVGDYAYIQNANGVAACLKVATGETMWEERLGGESWSSLVYADGRLYSLNMAGETHVFEAKPEYKLLATNSVGEYALASLAPSDGQFFIRTHQNLWCVGKK